MSNASLPLILYRANLQLWLRIGQLLEDNREQWTDLLAGELEERLAGAQAGQPQGTDWTSQSMLPGNELWRLAERQAGDLQALAQAASGNQMTFVNGFQQALAEWQEATAGALGEVSADAALPDRMFEGLREVLDNLSGTLPPSAAPAPAAAARTARPAAKRAASKPAKRATGTRPAKKAAARKAAPSSKPAGKATKKTAKKAAVKKTAGKRAGVKKTARRKASPNKAAAKKATSKKAATKKAASKKTAARKAARKAAR